MRDKEGVMFSARSLLGSKYQRTAQQMSASPDSIPIMVSSLFNCLKICMTHNLYEGLNVNAKDHNSTLNL